MNVSAIQTADLIERAERQRTLIARVEDEFRKLSDGIAPGDPLDRPLRSGDVTTFNPTGDPNNGRSAGLGALLEGNVGLVVIGFLLWWTLRKK